MEQKDDSVVPEPMQENEIHATGHEKLDQCLKKALPSLKKTNYWTLASMEAEVNF